MKVSVRTEQPQDYSEVSDLIQKAFESDPHSDHIEAQLVEALRKPENFIPELSIVAEVDGKVVGHVLLTPVKIKNKDNEWDSLALAPISVLPVYQNQGIGSQLIKEAHSRARKIGYKSIVLIGHENYYLKFGYLRAEKYGIRFPFDVPAENAFAIELTEGALNEVNGTVVYPSEFQAV